MIPHPPKKKAPSMQDEQGLLEILFYFSRGVAYDYASADAKV